MQSSEFIHRQTSITVQAYVLPSLSSSRYTRSLPDEAKPCQSLKISQHIFAFPSLSPLMISVCEYQTEIGNQTHKYRNHSFNALISASSPVNFLFIAAMNGFLSTGHQHHYNWSWDEVTGLEELHACTPRDMRRNKIIRRTLTLIYPNAPSLNGVPDYHLHLPKQIHMRGHTYWISKSNSHLMLLAVMEVPSMLEI
ncbi:hypothetical protein Q3G72_020988 [Acer saccharum]|nr:hypothetical protein Q3G72_020988 [Acer saccharum]